LSRTGQRGPTEFFFAHNCGKIAPGLIRLVLKQRLKQRVDFSKGYNKMGLFSGFEPDAEVEAGNLDSTLFPLNVKE
jgi:hypothetical protein